MTLFLTAILLGIAVRWVLFRRLVMPRIAMPWLFFAALGWEAAWAFLSLRGWFSPQVAGPVGQMGTLEAGELARFCRQGDLVPFLAYGESVDQVL